jgi:hypothetical protein
LIAKEDGAKQAVFHALGFVDAGVGEGASENRLAVWQATSGV